MHVEFNCVVIVLSHNTLRFIHATMDMSSSSLLLQKLLLGIEKTASQYQRLSMNILTHVPFLFPAIFSHGDSFKIKCVVETSMEVQRLRFWHIHAQGTIQAMLEN